HETARFCIKRTTAAKLLNFQVTDLKRKFRRNRQILREKDDYPAWASLKIASAASTRARWAARSPGVIGTGTRTAITCPALI
ncbi:hypothetical protein KKP06_16085, partial [Ralstonia pickettii]|uniref:hypothetical protein n=1 Tax=Ralstonia pickettii TaxID=329 RepID=UPI001BE456C6